jgi:hypothetical protein
VALQAELLADAVVRAEPRAVEVLHFAEVDTEVQGASLDLETPQPAVAKNHWYADWADALAHGKDTIHAGDLDAIRHMLDDEPALVRMRSPFPHRLTLLHHLAANGSEVERQLGTPGNVVEILRGY